MPYVILLEGTMMVKFWVSLIEGCCLPNVLKISCAHHRVSGSMVSAFSLLHLGQLVRVQFHSQSKTRSTIANIEIRWLANLPWGGQTAAFAKIMISKLELTRRLVQGI